MSNFLITNNKRTCVLVYCPKSTPHSHSYDHGHGSRHREARADWPAPNDIPRNFEPCASEEDDPLNCPPLLQTTISRQRISLKLDCEMDLASYPHDVQQCEILIMSLQHTTDNVILQWKEFEITKNILLAQYYVSGNFSTNGTKKYDIGEFSFVSGKIHLSRRLGYFLINKYIPCVLIICMSFITFWIPAEAYPARVTLSVTSLLTIVTQQYQSAMPSVSYVVALNIWMLSCIGFVFCSLLEYAFVIAVMNNKGTDLWPFKKLKKLFHPSKTPNDHEAGKSPNHTSPESSKMSHQSIDKISRFIFPLCFFLFCISYFIYFCR
ncbi:glycine receptor subunit alpha-1 [Trichonephila clavipes]|uniref:Glycine receptor subunit alpha-1 n=1 Tax=Trichonephila clavipes TaxID=2585209 RepID=A0A8X6RRW0_TRICX|nr:glycine receptor subunit alpha-1 [Trichonephila clavipes]